MNTPSLAGLQGINPHSLAGLQGMVYSVQGEGAGGACTLALCGAQHSAMPRSLCSSQRPYMRTVRPLQTRRTILQTPSLQCVLQVCKGRTVLPVRSLPASTPTRRRGSGVCKRGRGLGLTEGWSGVWVLRSRICAARVCHPPRSSTATWCRGCTRSWARSVHVPVEYPFCMGKRGY